MSDKEREEFLNTIDTVVEKSFDTDSPLRRLSETQHLICRGQEVLLQIHEAARFIEVKKPYLALPESLQHLVDYGKKVGFRIDYE